MSKKTADPPKRVDPRAQPIRRPDDKEAPSEPDDRKHPARDIREMPAPNPNGDPADGS